MNDEIITEIRQLWPECRMVRGSPRHSQSNGGIERANCTVQYKLGAWMTKNTAVRCSVGCRIVMWRINTQQHRTIGDIPYRLSFGQLPRVGIARLPLAQELIDRLATEAELNRVFEIEEPLYEEYELSDPPVDNAADDDRLPGCADNVDNVGAATAAIGGTTGGADNVDDVGAAAAAIGGTTGGADNVDDVGIASAAIGGTKTAAAGVEKLPGGADYDDDNAMTCNRG